MATIVNNPPSANTADNGMGFLLGVILFVALVVLFIVYGLPYISRGNSPVNIPGRIDVNIQQPGK